MIGNDVVDLKLAEIQSNWRRKGFLDKICSPLEQRMISASLKPDLTFWRLWSMKESAYKAFQRKSKQRKVNPLAFKCQLINGYEGLVNCNAELYHAQTESSKDFVHTYAYSDEFKAELAGKLIDLNPDQLNSIAFYNKVISSLSQVKGWVKKDISLKKNSHGIPEVHNLKGNTTVLCSLSHHGRFGSYLVSGTTAR